MVALLVAIAFVAVTLFVLAVAGVLMAVVTAIASLNIFVVILGLISRRAPTTHPAPRKPWQPSSFRLPPQPPAEPADESEEPAPSITIHRR
jgi:hypothetical protein